MTTSTSKTLNPYESIVQWNTLRMEKPEEIANLFAKSGNNFPLSLGNVSTCSGKLHIYFGFNNSNIEFVAIPSDSDRENANRDFRDLNLYSVPLAAKTAPVNSEGPNESKLIDWIENWYNDVIRNEWFSGLNKSNGNQNNIVQAFTINTTDFEMNTVHQCYLALRPDEEGENSYTIDLVIENTKANVFLNSEEPEFRDMARPVPPFGQEAHPSTDFSNFGILEALAIN